MKETKPNKTDLQKYDIAQTQLMFTERMQISTEIDWYAVGVQLF